MTIPAFQFFLFGTLCALVASDIRVILDNAKVIAKGSFTNKFYYISKSSFPSFAKAKDWCAANGGGYPAEIDTFEEFNFLKSLLKGNSGLRVYIAGTDAQRDGTWVSQRTGVQLNVFDWTPPEPNNYQGQEDCIELMADAAGRMNDNVCVNVAGTLNVLCEKDLF